MQKQRLVNKQKRPTRGYVNERYCGELQATRQSLYRMRKYVADRTDDLKLNSKLYSHLSTLIEETGKIIQLLRKEEN